MNARAIWKGVIAAKGIELPVKLYAAVQDRDVHFHLLHDADNVRVEQRIVDPASGEAVDPSQVQRGYQVAPGSYVVVSKAELETIEPKASRELEITRCVPLTALHPRWFARPYYLGPDGKHDEYLALARALTQREQQGIVRWVMRNKSYVGALRARGDLLQLIALRHSDDMVDVDELSGPKLAAQDAREVKLAEQLVAALSGELDLTQFNDDYRARVLKFVEQKAHGKARLPAHPKRRAANVSSLTSALQASLKHAGSAHAHTAAKPKQRVAKHAAKHTTKHASHSRQERASA